MLAIVKPEDLAPADPVKCIYCGRRVGMAHRDDCCYSHESVPCLIEITDTHTGETRILKEETKPTLGGFHYLWSEGNYSCDCNRSIFFHNAKWPSEDGPSEEEMFIAKCGDGRYRVRIVEEATGECVYEDD